MPSLNEARRLSRTLTFLRPMTVWKKENCEVFLERLPGLIPKWFGHSKKVNEPPPQQAAGYQNMAMRIYPKGVTPFNRGSSPSFAWIPAKNMRE
jgi:hypothetical protein